MEGNLCVCFFFAEHPTSLFSPQKGARVKSKQNEKLIFNAAFQAFKTGSWRTVLSSNGSVFFLNDVNPLLTAVVLQSLESVAHPVDIPIHQCGHSVNVAMLPDFFW